MDLETIVTLIGAAKGVVGITKGATEIAQNIETLIDKPDPDPDAAKRLVSDLLNSLIRLQTEQLAMQSAILDFQEEQRRIERFRTEADRYELKKTEQGSLVYELKPSHAGGDPDHCICATCYEKQIKSVLQPVAHNTLSCTTCGGTFYRPDGQGSGVLVARTRRTDFDGFV